MTGLGSVPSKESSCSFCATRRTGSAVTLVGFVRKVTGCKKNRTVKSVTDLIRVLVKIFADNSFCPTISHLSIYSPWNLFTLYSPVYWVCVKTLTITNRITKCSVFTAKYKNPVNISILTLVKSKSFTVFPTSQSPDTSANLAITHKMIISCMLI
jgi:hypothetical protein